MSVIVCSRARLQSSLLAPAASLTQSNLPRLQHCEYHRIPEPQHGRGRQGPLWVTQPNPLPKQGHPQQAAQHRGQAGLEYLQRRRLHNLPGQPGPGLRHPQREEVPPRVHLMLVALLTGPIFFVGDASEFRSVKNRIFPFVDKDLYHLNLLF